MMCWDAIESYRNISLMSGLGSSPETTILSFLMESKNVTITDLLYLGTCDWWVMFVPRLGLKSKYFVHVNESTVLTGLHLSRLSNPHITCKAPYKKYLVSHRRPTLIWGSTQHIFLFYIRDIGPKFVSQILTWLPVYIIVYHLSLTRPGGRSNFM